MAKPHQRIFALILAILFLATSLAAGAAVIYQIRQDERNAEVADELRAAQETLNSEDVTQDTNDTNNENQEENPGMLQGTKLANFDPVGETNELKVIDLVEGTGEAVPEGATITAHYTGAYAVNGEIFESSKDRGQPATFPLDGVIEGWQEGVPGMKVGGVRRLIIPGNMAYGEAPEGYEPGSSGRPLGTLVFDIELSEIEQ